MTKDEAVSCAQDYVRSNYPVVPAVGIVMHFAPQSLGREQQVRVETWMPVYIPGVGKTQPGVVVLDAASTQARELTKWLGKWLIGFRTSWDTDDAGMPQGLQLIVKDLDSSVEPMEEWSPPDSEIT